jgi:hypothetical protein
VPPLHQAPAHEAIDKLDRRVMLDLEPLGQDTDRRRRPTPLEPLDLEQEEVLLGRHARAPSRDLTSPEKSSNLIAQVGKRTVIDPCMVTALHRIAGDRRKHRTGLYITA